MESGAAYPMPIFGPPIYRFQSATDCKRFQTYLAALRREDAVTWLTEESKKVAAREFARIVETAWCQLVVWGRDAWGLFQWDKVAKLYRRDFGGPASKQRLSRWFGEKRQD